MIPRAQESLAPPARCARCDALMREDTEFATTAIRYQQPQRRFLCMMGHTVYTGLQEAAATWQEKTLAPALAKPVPGRCHWCGEEYVGVVRQKYCSPECARAKSVSDEASRRARTNGVKLHGAALRQARAIAGVWNRQLQGEPPIPYATRPSKLNNDWV